MMCPSINVARWVLIGAILSAPLLLLGNTPILEGVLGVHIPASALMVVVPTTVTIIEAGRLGRLSELRGIARFAKSDLVVVPVAVFIPFTVTAVDQWLQGNSFPDAQGVALVLGSASIFVVAAVLEELGWNAWLMRGLSSRLGIVKSSLFVGGLWAIWHVLPWFRLGHTFDWVVGQASSTIAIRWLIGELSLIGNRWLWPAVAAHASGNLAWSLTADSGDSFRPQVSAIGLALVAAVFWIRRRRI